MLPETLAERHRAVAAAFGERVRGTRDWDVPAPVDGWTARSVVDHLTSWFPDFLASGAGVELPKADPDPVVAWQAQARADREIASKHHFFITCHFPRTVRALVSDLWPMRRVLLEAVSSICRVPGPPRFLPG